MKSWEELCQKYSDALDINIYPDMQWLEDNHIIDREQSVRWNDEQREESNRKYKELLNKNMAAKMDVIDAVREEIYVKIIEEVNYPIDRTKAKMIWIKASDECEECGYEGAEAVIDFLKDTIEFVNDIVGTYKIDNERLGD